MDTEASPDLQVIYGPVAEDMGLLSLFLKKEFSASEPFIWEILQHIARFEGKQIRPALLFLSRRLAGATSGDAVDQDHVKIGAVIELVHTATLVHDDILDDAFIRRNVETVHRRWGERAAVLIGDFIYSRAFQLSTEVPGMASILSETTHTICEGELLQIGLRFEPEIDEETYLEIIKKKTAILYAVSCRLGGVLGGLDPVACRRLEEFGMALGMAFQIVDDCLDYAGKESVAGKSLGTDLRQGKVTLPLIHLRECLSADDARWLHDALRDRLSPEAESRIQWLVRHHDVVAGAFARAEEYIGSAKAKLAEVPGGDARSLALKESLELTADYVLRRQR
jgi:octaprenyl-diphosphate synthase